MVCACLRTHSVRAPGSLKCTDHATHQRLAHRSAELALTRQDPEQAAKQRLELGWLAGWSAGKFATSILNFVEKETQQRNDDASPLTTSAGYTQNQPPRCRCSGRRSSTSAATSTFTSSATTRSERPLKPPSPRGPSSLRSIPPLSKQSNQSNWTDR